jgi:hypothetical protein
MKRESEKKIDNQKGQTFLEFIFLLLILITMSFSFMSGFRGYIGTRWETMVKLIASPNQNEVSMP